MEVAERVQRLTLLRHEEREREEQSDVDPAHPVTPRDEPER